MDLQKDDKNNQSMYFRPIEEHPNYKEKIRVHLNELMMMNSKSSWKEVRNLLNSFKFYSTGKNLSQDTQYRILSHPEFEKDMQTSIIQLLSKIARTVLEMEGVFKERKIKILQRGKNQQIEFTKDQIFYIMCLLALNLVPTQVYAQNQNIKQNYSLSNNFSFIFSHHPFKCSAVINYFIQNLKNPFIDKKNQKFIIRRKCLQNSIQEIIKTKGYAKMIPFQLRKDNESIESFSGSGKVDFANQYIGGGALHGPCVQEEIMFANCPELFVSMIFCESMDDSESIVLQGFKKYSNNSGYGQGTNFDFEYKIDWKTFNQQQEYVVAIDAICYPNKEEQFKKKLIDRELVKSFCGFSNFPEHVKDVVTGNWGCGAFGGEMTVKFIIQWISCSLAGKRMVYCPFGSSKLIRQSEKFLSILSNKKIKEVYEILLEAGENMKNGETNIFRKIQKILG